MFVTQFYLTQLLLKTKHETHTKTNTNWDMLLIH